jgi:hypothetical protein
MLAQVEPFAGQLARTGTVSNRKRARRRRPALKALNRSFMSAVGQPAAVSLTATAGIVGGGTDVAIASVAATGGLVFGLLPDFFSAVTTRISGARAKSAGAALLVATETAGVTDDEFVTKIESNPFVARVAYDALQGAADATYDEKIEALGEVLGRALSAESLRDQRRLLAQSTILRELEEVHAALLWTLTMEPPSAGTDEDGEWMGWTYATLQQELFLGALLTPVVERLLAQGLIHDMVQSDGQRSNYALSAWGQEILDLLMSRDSRDPDSPAEPEV